jgi:hypothetical protein
MKMRTLLNLGGAGLLALPAGCVHVSSDPIRVEPIHIVADINLRIDRQLDDFFAFENKYQGPATTQSTTQPQTVDAQ